MSSCAEIAHWEIPGQAADRPWRSADSATGQHGFCTVRTSPCVCWGWGEHGAAGWLVWAVPETSSLA